MRYRITLKQGFEVLLTGELEAPEQTGKLVLAQEAEERLCNRLDNAVFSVERAINANTDIRAHIDRLDDNA